jgi:hypothetical protein
MKKRRQKPYVPKPVRQNPLQIYSEDVARSMLLVPHLHLDQFKRGTGTVEGWAAIAARLNFGQVLSLRHFGEGPQTALNAGVEVMQAVVAHHALSGQYVMTDAQVCIVGEAIQIVDDMQQQTTKREHAAALRTMSKIANSHPGASGDVIEIDDQTPPHE